MAAAAAAGLAVIAQAAGAAAAALFLFRDGEAFDEFWHPAEMRSDGAAERLRDTARAWSSGEPPRDSPSVRAYPLVSGNRTLGEICLLAAAGTEATWRPEGDS